MDWLTWGTTRRDFSERDVFGDEHLATGIAKDTAHYFNNLVYPGVAWQPDDMRMELVPGFDRGSAGYIA